MKIVKNKFKTFFAYRAFFAGRHFQEQSGIILLAHTSIYIKNVRSDSYIWFQGRGLSLRKSAVIQGCGISGIGKDFLFFKY